MSAAASLESQIRDAYRMVRAEGFDHDKTVMAMCMLVSRVGREEMERETKRRADVGSDAEMRG